MATNGSPGELTTRQKRAVAALMTARTTAQAAGMAQVGERTLYRWMVNDPAFRAAVREAEEQAIDAAARRLAGLAGDAVDTFASTLDGGASPALKLRAAQVVLDDLLRLRELASLERRILALEARLDE